MSDGERPTTRGPSEGAGAAHGDGATEHIRRILQQVRESRLSVDAGLDQLRALPFEEMGFARLDHHRALRTGFAEVIFCEGKTPEEVAALVGRAAAWNGQVLGTRAGEAQYEAARAEVPDLQYDRRCRVLWLDRNDAAAKRDGAAVVAAGTSDLPVAEEAARTLELMGHRPERVTDVGVAGLHRLMPSLPALRRANAIVVVAGMEGALPSVVAGLVSAPVIAVPTSVGYGASFDGLAALLGMLSSCAAGISVVNIDNGFGAGYMAATINRLAHGDPPERRAAENDDAPEHGEAAP